MSTTCSTCGKTFSTFFNLNKHRRNVHRIDNTHKSYKYDAWSHVCLEKNCSLSFRRNTELIKHLGEIHNIIVKIQELEFPDMDAFETWKDELEFRKKCTYVLSRGTRVNKKGEETIHFVCNRSGKERYIGLPPYKLGRSCLSEIKVVKKDNRILATHVKNHYGHNIFSHDLETLCTHSVETNSIKKNESRDHDDGEDEIPEIVTHEHTEKVKNVNLETKHRNVAMARTLMENGKEDSPVASSGGDKMPSCAAVNCSNRSEKGFRLFIFPRDVARRAKWLENMRRDNWTPSNRSRLCNAHFEDSQFENHRADGWRKLKPNAIPTLFDLSNPSPTIDPHPQESLYKHPTTNPSSSKPVKGSKKKILKPAIKTQKEINENCETIENNERNTSSLQDGSAPSHDAELLKWKNQESELNLEEQIKSSEECQNRIIKSEQEMEVEDIDLDGPGGLTPYSDDMVIVKEENWQEVAQDDECDSVQSKLAVEQMEKDPVQKQTGENVDEGQQALENIKKRLCRVCGKKDELLFPIFETYSQNVNDVPMSVKIDMYLPIKVEAGDGLPSGICSLCSVMVNRWHDLNVTSLSADAALRKIFCKTGFQDCETVNLQNVAKKYRVPDSLIDSNQECNRIDENNFEPLPSKETTENLFSEDATPVRPSLLPCCCYCRETFDFYDDRRSHIVACREMPAVCELCGLEVPKRKLLSKHKVKHTDKKKYSRTFMCEKCAKWLCSAQALEYHTAVAHNDQCVPKYCCELCCKVMYSKHHYLAHQKSHAAGRIKAKFKVSAIRRAKHSSVYLCPVCKQTFSDKLKVVIHLTSIKVLKCPKCHVRLRSEKKLLFHKCKKFFCDQCPMNFYHKQLLEAHKKKHEGNVKSEPGQENVNNELCQENVKSEPGQENVNNELCQENVKSEPGQENVVISVIPYSDCPAE